MPKSTKKRQNLPQKPALDGHVPNDQQALGNVTVGHVAINSGPLPSVNAFAGYEHTLPGAAERIMAMAEKEQLHRHEGELQTIELHRLAIQEQSRTICRAQWFALTCALVILGVGALLVLTGNPIPGTLLSGGTIASVVWAFVYSTGTQKTQVDLANKQNNKR